MPQVSRRKLDKTLEDEMFRQFWKSLSHLREADQVAEFFSDLLTETEEIMLAKRFTVAVLIMRGNKAVDIASTLNVSYTTIGTVAGWVKNAKPKTRRLLQSVIKAGEWQRIIDRIEELLDKIPPSYGTDWATAGRKKWKRKQERRIRNSLY